MKERRIMIEMNVETFELCVQPDVSFGTQQAAALSSERCCSNTVLLFVSWDCDLLRLSRSFFLFCFFSQPGVGCLRFTALLGLSDVVH